MQTPSSPVLPLMILVAGPYRSGTGDDPVFDEIFHPVSRTLVSKCDACLRIGGASKGVDEMVALTRSHGRAVYFRVEDVPGCGGGG